MSWAADRSVTVRRVADRSGIALAPNLGADRSGMLADRTAMDHARSRSGFDDRSRTKNARIDNTVCAVELIEQNKNLFSNTVHFIS